MSPYDSNVGSRYFEEFRKFNYKLTVSLTLLRLRHQTHTDDTILYLKAILVKDDMNCVKQMKITF